MNSTFNSSVISAAVYQCSSSNYDTSDPYDPYGGSFNSKVVCDPGFFINALSVQLCGGSSYFVELDIYCTNGNGDFGGYKTYGPGIQKFTDCAGHFNMVDSGGYTGWAMTINGVYWYQTGGPSFSQGSWGNVQTCPGDYMIVGFHGRYGTGIDLANILCRRACVCAGGTYNNLGTCSSCDMSCGSGQYHTFCGGNSAGSCVACGVCDVGYYRSGCSGTSPGSCVQCGAVTVGYYFTTANSCDSSMCSSGYYSNNQWSISCDSCPVGFYCTQGIQNACPAGTYNNLKGQSSCYACSAGTYSKDPGAIVCLDCNTGTYSLDNSALCTSCPVGKYNPSLKGTTDASCLLCDVGTYNPSLGSVSAAACLPCGAGYYGSGTGVSSCTLCGPGTANSGNGARYQCPSCLASSTYMLNSGSTQCIPCSTPQCDVGHEVNVCTPTSDSFCKPCTAIPLCTYTEARCMMADLKTPRCQCSAGYQLTSSAPFLCQLCPAGTYKANSDYSPCIPWSVTVCPQPGTYLVFGSAFSDSICLPCPTLPDNAVRTVGECNRACDAGFNNNNG